MNASVSISALSLVGNTTIGLPGQTPEGHESAFGDMLSLAIAGSAIQPAMQPANPNHQELSSLLQALGQRGDGDGDLDIGDLASLLGLAGEQALFPPLSTSQLNSSDGTDGTDGTDGSPLLTPAATRTLPQPWQVAFDDQALTPMSSNGSGQHAGKAIFDPSAVSDQTPIAEKALSSSALATAKSEAGDPLGQQQVLPQLRQYLASQSDRPSASHVNSTALEPLDDGHLAPSLYQINSSRAANQKPQLSAQQLALAQQVDGQTVAASPAASHGLQAGQQAAKLLSANDLVQPAQKSATSVIQTVGVVETTINDQQPSFDSLEVLNTEPGRLDTSATTSSKPSSASIQPPNMQIALQIARSIPQGIDRFSIQLHPMELGAVEVQLNFAEDGRVNALIVAERSETLDLLQRDSRALERSLANTGLELDSGGLSFSLKQEQDQKGQNFSSDGFQQMENRFDDGGHDSGQDHMPEQDIRVSRQRLLDIRT